MNERRDGAYWRTLLLATLVMLPFSCGAAGAATNKVEPALDYLRSFDAYQKRRGEVEHMLRQQRFSAGVPLSAIETNVDLALSLLRSNEITYYKTNGRSVFPPSRLFFDAKADIEASKLFPILKRMPKGGLLHTHDLSMGRGDFIITNITYRPDCYIQWTEASQGYLAFLTNGQAPSSLTNNGYYPASTLRKEFATKGLSFDHELRRLIMIDRSDPRTMDIWDAFGPCFMRTLEVIKYRPVWRDYLRDAFKTLVNDGIRHVDIRAMAPVPNMYDQSGRTNSERDALQEYLDARDFVRTNCGVEFTVKLIMTGYRGNAASDATNIVKKAQEYQRMFPELVVGCDWVGQEDGGQTTLAEVPYLLKVANNPQSGLHFYFHDGETAWFGNHNLVDAVLLKAKRVGHGFDLFRFPHLEQLIIDHGIAVEVCPISNQLLRLMQDIRLHPAIGYMGRGVECVLGSDDPAIFGNDGLTYDFWEAYMAWGIDLRAVKRLAENSLIHSALNSEERDKAHKSWQRQWAAWIESVATNLPALTQ